MSLVLPSLIGASKPADGSYSRFSVSFDGTDDYISLGSSFTLSGAWSASFWVKPSKRSDNTFNMNLFGNSSSGSFYIFIGSDGKVRVNNIEISNALTDGVWQNIVVTRDGLDSLKGYVNGISQVTDTFSSNLTFDQIGRYFNGTTANFKGLMDEVAIFGTALSALQITNIYRGEDNNGSGSTENIPGDLSTFNPVGWWRMGDGSDGSGNADGTVVNIGGTNFPQIYNVATDGSGNRITGIDGSMTNIASPNGIVKDVPS